MAQQQQSQSKHSQQSQVQIPTAADISLLLSLGMGGLDASQLANLDLQKLAMYLVSIHFEIRSTDNFQTFKFHFFRNSLKKSFAFKLNQKRKIGTKDNSTILAMLLASSFNFFIEIVKLKS